MNRKVYCGCDSDFLSHYKSQSGRGYDEINVFKGQPYQRGYGIGSFMKRIGIPIFRSLLKTGLDIGNDIVDNKNFKETLIRHSKTGLKSAAKTGLAEMSNFIDQAGSGIRKRRAIQLKRNKAKKRRKRKVKKLVIRRKKSNKKSRKRDIFS